MNDEEQKLLFKKLYPSLSSTVAPPDDTSPKTSPASSLSQFTDSPDEKTTRGRGNPFAPTDGNISPRTSTGAVANPNPDVDDTFSAALAQQLEHPVEMPQEDVISNVNLATQGPPGVSSGTAAQKGDPTKLQALASGPLIVGSSPAKTPTGVTLKVIHPPPDENKLRGSTPSRGVGAVEKVPNFNKPTPAQKKKPPD